MHVCTLLDKRARCIAEVGIRYVGFEVGDECLFGYWLDHVEKFRNLLWGPFLLSLSHAGSAAGAVMVDPSALCRLSDYLRSSTASMGLYTFLATPAETAMLAWRTSTQWRSAWSRQCPRRSGIDGSTSRCG